MPSRVFVGSSTYEVGGQFATVKRHLNNAKASDSSFVELELLDESGRVVVNSEHVTHVEEIKVDKPGE